jgi:chlorite dismutase
VAEQNSAQYVAYTLYRVDPVWRRLPVEERAAGKDAFAEVVSDWAGRMELRSYSLVGVRPEADFMLWKLTERYEDLRELAPDLIPTALEYNYKSP